MTRLSKFAISLICLLFETTCIVFSQISTPASVTGRITAEVIPIFSATEISQMNFGRFSPGPQGGRIILTPQSTISVLGSVFKGTGTCNAASFYVSGDLGSAYSINLPAGPVVLTHVSAAKTMLVRDWVSIPSPGTGTGMLQDGFQIIYVGATLDVGTMEDNPVGIYTGTFEISFDFN